MKRTNEQMAHLLMALSGSPISIPVINNCNIQDKDSEYLFVVTINDREFFEELLFSCLIKLSFESQVGVVRSS